MHNKFLHHLATAAGFAFLIFCYWLLKKLGYFDWASQLLPMEYAGAGLMLGIGSGMLIPFALWNLFTRWIEKKLRVKGQYFEDSYYKDDESKK